MVPSKLPQTILAGLYWAWLPRNKLQAMNPVEKGEAKISTGMIPPSAIPVPKSSVKR